MTHPPPVTVSLVDPGNTLLAKVQARIDTGSIDVPEAGKVGVLTIRTASTTLTVLLTVADMLEWAGLLTACAEQMTSSVVIAASPVDMVELSRLEQQKHNGGRGR